jgi:hypothetical protein
MNSVTLTRDELLDILDILKLNEELAFLNIITDSSSGIGKSVFVEYLALKWAEENPVIHHTENQKC